VTIVAIMTVRRAALETFRAFEREAAAVMATHGGRIERTIVVPGDADVLKEIHVVTFPHEQAYAAYRGDDRRRALAPLRDESVVHTEVLIGEDGPRYGVEGPITHGRDPAG
jgi:antibiotic biosynthesis monooxygenase (ABM) superfamily enzyme